MRLGPGFAGGFRNNFVRAVIPLLFVLAVGTLYFYNLGGWLIQDDEGTDLYEIWRLGQGDAPGVDVITEQPPVFLLGGMALGRLSDYNVLVLRGASTALVLGSACLVLLLGHEIWNRQTGLIGAVIYLLNHLVHAQARLFRPDPWMLAFSIAGLYLFVLAQTRERRLLFLLSGAAYGIATLCKLFGVLPLGGCLLSLTYQALSDRRHRSTCLKNITLLLASFLVVTLAGMLAFYPPDSAYYDTVLGQHWQLGQQEGSTHRLVQGLVGLADFIARNLAFMFAIPLVHRLAASRKAGERAVAWQIPTGLAYFILSRPLYARYWLYLVPTLSLILARLIDRLLEWMGSRPFPTLRKMTPLAAVLLMTMTAAQSLPRILHNTLRRERDTRSLASYIATHTEPDDVVLTDYAGLNFYARRRSIPQASTIAEGRIRGGYVTTARLVSEIESRDVRMVLLHVPGGTAGPSHLINLQHYERFYAYVRRHFRFTGTFNRAGQVFEIYQLYNTHQSAVMQRPNARAAPGQRP